MAHRGASCLAPENTLASIELDWELGADAAECDVMLTADQKALSGASWLRNSIETME